MYNCLHFTRIATLLIGLYIFSPNIGDAKLEASTSHQGFLVAFPENNSPKLDRVAQGNSEFEPPDKGGPDITRGSGTR
jgi:hypothetical protein